MATRSQAVLFAQLIAEFKPEIHRAFMASVTDLHAHVDWAQLIDALRSGNTEGAISALNINEAAWREYASSMTDVYAKSGAATAAQITQAGTGGVGTRFNMSNPRAARWISENVAERVVGFTNESVQVARSVIESGYAKGAGPRTIATDLAGRVKDGARSGGVIGLDNPRAQRLQRVTEGMRTPEGVKSLVTQHRDGSLSVKYKVNKATEMRILKAYRNETEVPEADRIVSANQYRNALLKDRAETIAETETANAVMSGRYEEWQQLAEQQGVSKDGIIKTWRHRRGPTANHRPDHLAMSGREVVGLDTPFVFPDGAALLFSHDPNAGPSHIIRCGCDVEFRVDHTAGLE